MPTFFVVSIIAWSSGAPAQPPVLLESEKLVAPDATSTNQLGFAVDVDGETLVLGTRTGDVAYLFEQLPGPAEGWSYVTELVAADGAINNGFGQTVAISGDTVAVGAPNDSQGCTPAPCSSGAVYVYERDQGGQDRWGQVRKILALDAVTNGDFGRAIDLDGDTLVVGAPGDLPNGGSRGSVYVFERSLLGPLWGESKKVRASDAGSAGVFGGAVSLDRDTLLVGTIQGNSGGAAYVFGRDRDGMENWGQSEKIVRGVFDSTVGFGAAVAISGDFALVGAPSDDEACTAPTNCNAGAVHLFERDFLGAENWGEVAKRTASDFVSGAFFGSAVAMAPGMAIVGAFGDLDDGVRSGSAYLFFHGPGGSGDWFEAAKLLASDRDVDDQLGFAVATDGPTAIAGAPLDRGVCCSSGAAYVFELEGLATQIFEDGFASGDTAAWAATAGGST